MSWEPEDLESQLMPEQLRLGMARAGCILAIDRLLAVQLDQLDELGPDTDDDADVLVDREMPPPSREGLCELDALLVRLHHEKLLTSSDCDVVRVLRSRAADVAE